MSRDPATTDPLPPPAFDRVWHDEHRDLVGLAARMLGDAAAAEDVVQDAFDRLSRERLDSIENPRGWLTTVVRRLCLNRISSAYSRREAAAGAAPPDAGTTGPAAVDPADRVTLDDQVRHALSLVLDRLTPAERTTFVLHDVFGFPFEGVAEIVGRTPAACRQLAGRARRSIRADAPPRRQAPTVPPEREHLLADRFIAACAGGDIAELLTLLDPDVDGKATLIGHGALGHVEGTHAVAARAVELFGPASDMTLVPFPLDGRPGFAAVGANRVVVVRLEEANGLVRKLRAFVRFRS